MLLKEITIAKSKQHRCILKVIAQFFFFKICTSGWEVVYNMHNHVGGEINMSTCGWEYVNVCTLHNVLYVVYEVGGVGVCVSVWDCTSRWFPSTVNCLKARICPQSLLLHMLRIFSRILCDCLLCDASSL